MDEDKRYGLFLRAFQMGLEQLGITDIHFSPVKVSKDSYNVINREDNKLVFTMIRETNNKDGSISDITTEGNKRRADKMKVKILKDCEHTGIKAGEIYEAEPYHLDPSSKVVLLERVPDGFDPCCTEYRYNVETCDITTEGNKRRVR